MHENRITTITEVTQFELHTLVSKVRTTKHRRNIAKAKRARASRKRNRS